MKYCSPRVHQWPPTCRSRESGVKGALCGRAACGPTFSITCSSPVGILRAVWLCTWKNTQRSIKISKQQRTARPLPNQSVEEWNNDNGDVRRNNTHFAQYPDKHSVSDTNKPGLLPGGGILMGSCLRCSCRIFINNINVMSK